MAAVAAAVRSRVMWAVELMMSGKVSAREVPPEGAMASDKRAAQPAPSEKGVAVLAAAATAEEASAVAAPEEASAVVAPEEASAVAARGAPREMVGVLVDTDCHTQVLGRSADRGC